MRKAIHVRKARHVKLYGTAGASQRKSASATRKQRRLAERNARKAKKNDGQNDQ